MKSPLFLATLGVLAFSWLDGTQSAGQDKKVPPSTAEQAGTAVTGQAYLEKFVGNFEVERVFYGPKGGTPTRTKGTCKQSMQQGGKFLFCDYTFGEGTAATTGLGIIGYIPDSGLFISTWVDSRATKMSLRQSREKFNGKEITLFSGTLNNDPKARVSRTVSTVEEDGRKILHRQFNIVDGKEAVFMELHLTRK